MRKASFWFNSIVLFFISISCVCWADRFRYGTISWQQYAKSGGTGRDVVFTISSAWKKSYYNSGAVNVGDVLSDPTIFYPDSTTTSSKTTFSLTVTSIDNGSDWFTASQSISYSYSTDATFVAYFQGCCRLPTLINNPSLYYKVSASVLIVQGATRNSMTSSALPVVTLIQNTYYQFSLGVQTSNNEVLRYRLATSSEAAGDTYTYNQVSGLSIDFTSGVISWLPSTIGVQSTQIIILGYSSTASPTSSTDTTNLETYIAVDFLLSVISTSGKVCKRFCANSASPCSTEGDCYSCGSGYSPYCHTNYPPFFSTLYINGVSKDLSTVNSGYSQTVSTSVSAGSTFTLLLNVSDYNSEDYITIAATGIPSTATAQQITNSNPAQYNMSWTPTGTSSGQVICFTATDSMDISNVGLLCVSISVTTGSLSVSGTDLYTGYAGKTGVFYISDSTNKVHSVSFTGTSSSAVGYVQGYGTSYNCSYNVASMSSTMMTKSGYYLVNISDITTSTLTTILKSLRIHATTTSSSNTTIFQSGSTGLIGGYQGTSVYFYIQARDKYGNNAESQGNDGFYAKVVLGSSSTTYNAVYMSNGKYNLTYSIPSATSSSNYFILVYYVNGTLVANKTASVTVTSWSISSVSPTALSYTAGDNITFSITVAAQSDGTTNSKSFEVLVDGVAATVGTASGGVYPVTGSPVTTIGTYAGGVVISASGLASSLTKNLIITAGSPVGSSSLLSGNAGEFTAGTTNTLYVYLKDAYENLITSGNDTVQYTYTIGGTTTSGSATFYSADASYAVPVYTTSTGSMSLNITVGSNGQVINGCPQTSVQVSPASFSLLKSSLGGIFSSTAGSSASLTVSAADLYGNARSTATDTWAVSMSVTKHGVTYTGNMTWANVPGTANYVMSYITTVSGTYSADLQVLLIADSTTGTTAYSSFSTPTVTIYASSVVPSNTAIAGSGITGGTQKESALLLFQARDTYDNIMESERGGFFVAVVTAQDGTNTYFGSRFCSPSASSCPLASTSVVFGNESSSLSSLSSEENAYISDGYWKTSYTVPTIPATGKTGFTISVYWCNFSDYTSGDSGSTIVARSTSVLVSTFSANSATAGAAVSVFVVTDNWRSVVIGISVGSIFLTAVIYGGWRLIRYRFKYKEQRVRYEKAEKELIEIGREIDVIPNKDWGGNDGGGMTLNPLLVKQADDKKTKEQVDDPNINMRKDRDAYRQEFKPVMPTLKFADAEKAP